MSWKIYLNDLMQSDELLKLYWFTNRYLLGFWGASAKQQFLAEDILSKPEIPMKQTWLPKV